MTVEPDLALQLLGSAVHGHGSAVEAILIDHGSLRSTDMPEGLEVVQWDPAAVQEVALVVLLISLTLHSQVMTNLYLAPFPRPATSLMADYPYEQGHKGWQVWCSPLPFGNVNKIPSFSHALDSWGQNAAER